MSTSYMYSPGGLTSEGLVSHREVQAKEFGMKGKNSKRERGGLAQSPLAREAKPTGLNSYGR